MAGQLENSLKKKYLIIREEHPITENELLEFENLKQVKFPQDYRNFLIEYNGGIPIIEKEKLEEFYSMVRFYSLGDIKLGVIENQREIEEFVKEDIEEWFEKLDFDKLFFIGNTERENLHIYCGEEDYGAIYLSNYSGGEGLEKTAYSSFSALLENVKWVGKDDEIEYNVYGKSFNKLLPNKVFTFDDLCYWEEDVKEQSLKRFKEVLDFYGHPNKEYTKYYSTREGEIDVIREEKIDVVSHYINKPQILEYLLNIGGKPSEQIKGLNNIESLKLLFSRNANLNGVLNSTRNLEVIKFLIEECNQDINKPFNEEYPLIKLTNVDDFYSIRGRIHQYELLEDIFSLGYNINLSLKDEKGRTIKERIEIIKREYKECKEKYPHIGK